MSEHIVQPGLQFDDGPCRLFNSHGFPVLHPYGANIYGKGYRQTRRPVDQQMDVPARILAIIVHHRNLPKEVFRISIGQAATNSR